MAMASTNNDNQTTHCLLWITTNQNTIFKFCKGNAAEYKKDKFPPGSHIITGVSGKYNYVFNCEGAAKEWQSDSKNVQDKLNQVMGSALRHRARTGRVKGNQVNRQEFLDWRKDVLGAFREKWGDSAVTETMKHNANVGSKHFGLDTAYF